EEAFRVPHDGVPGVYKPVVAQGLLISNDAHTVTATNPDGSTAWAYTRDNVQICSLATTCNRVVITCRSDRGCGDVVAIDAATGDYAHTRSANNSEEVIEN